MSRFVVLAAVLAALQGALAVNERMKEALAWKALDFQYPTAAAREAAIKSGEYIPENNNPLGMEVWNDKVFVTVPRWKSGVPSSVNYVKYTEGKHAPCLSSACFAPGQGAGRWQPLADGLGTLGTRSLALALGLESGGLEPLEPLEPGQTWCFTVQRPWPVGPAGALGGSRSRLSAVHLCYLHGLAPELRASACTCGTCGRQEARQGRQGATARAARSLFAIQLAPGARAARNGNGALGLVAGKAAKNSPTAAA